MVSTRGVRAVLLGAAALLACGTEPDNTPAALEPDGATSFAGTAGQALTQLPTVRVTTSSGKPLKGVTVQFTVTTGGGSTTGADVTDESGKAQTAWNLGATMGENALVASVTGVTQTVTFTATGAPGPPALLSVTAGNGQTAPVGSVLPTRPAVKVTDAFGNPSAVRVTFTVSAGGGSVADAEPIAGADGVATAGAWTLGPAAGTQKLTASVSGVVTAEIAATATAGAAARIRKSAGDQDIVVAGTAVPTPPRVRVVDAFDNPVSGVTVTFAADAGSGSITGAQQQTNAEGLATVGSWTLSPQVGTNKLTASSPGLTAVTFFVTGKAGPVTAISLSPDTLRVSPGDTVTLIATSTDANGNTTTNPTLLWSSSNTAIATVSSAGRVMAEDAGMAMIKANAPGVAQDSSLVVVAPGPPEVTTTNTAGMTASSVWLGASVVQRGDSTRVWFEYSTSPTLAGAAVTTKTLLGSGVIGNNRRISGLLPNTTYYYRALAENVVGKDTGAIVWSKTSPSGGRELLKQTGLAGITSRADFDVPAGTTRLEVSALTASTSEAAFLYVRFGQAAEVTAADCVSAFLSTAGEAQLQACAIENPTAGRWHVMILGFYSNVTLTALAHGLVEPVAVRVSPAADTLAVGATRQYSATVTGSTNTAVTWSSGNIVVASVSATGLVTARAVGDGAIIATSVADPTKTAIASLRVVANQIAIALDRANDTLGVDATRQLKATVTGTSDTSVTWSVTDFRVVTVSTTGLVTGSWKGTTQVKATSNADPTKFATATYVVTVPKLTIGTPLTGLSGLENSIRYYEITVPAGSPMVAVRSATDSGNVDLWLTRAGKPSSSTASCTIAGSTGNEVCEVNKASFAIGAQFDGDWYVALVGRQDYAISARTDYKNVTLSATADSTSTIGVQVLQNNVALTALAGVKDQLNSYKIYVPAGKASLEIKATGGTGKIFLLSRWRSMVDRSAGTAGYSCKQEAVDNVSTATCLYNNPTAGWYYIMIDGFNGYGGFTLTAKYPP